MDRFEQEVRRIAEWMKGPRFAGLRRLYSARQVAEQQGAIAVDYPVARECAQAFFDRLCDLFRRKQAITTFGPYSPGQAVVMKRAGIEGIYLGGWATSAKGSVMEDPGADLASYPLSQVPDEAASIVRALLTADRNQEFARSRLSEAERKATPAVDYRPFIIADADTGHGGDAHVRNLIRRFVEVGVTGYHIEDQKPGCKKCGHQGGKVLVPVDEQIKRLNTARFQLDLMQVPGLIVARTDAEAAALLDGRGDERDHPFVLGATNIALPSAKSGALAVQKRFNEQGVESINGHLLYRIPEAAYKETYAWLARVGLLSAIDDAAKSLRGNLLADTGKVLDKIVSRFYETWAAEAGIKTYARAVADAIGFHADEGMTFEMSVDQWLAWAKEASLPEAREKARELGVSVVWDPELARTPEGYYFIQGGIEYAIHRSWAVAPYCDLIWMETKTADLKDAREFAEAIHQRFPDKMLAYNLSPSFNWDTTGMSDEEMNRFPEELALLGYVFNFITYGGHQVDGVAAEEFATALMQDGMLALARLQRKIRLLESPYKTPQTLVGGPRLDEALMACSGRTATTAAMGKGSTQVQHLVQTEVPPSLLEKWLDLWCKSHDISGRLRVRLRPHTAGSDLLALQVLSDKGEKLAGVVFACMEDRRGRSILSIRDQNTFDLSLRKKRLMTLIHLFLIHRYKSLSVHYVSPTEDNQHQTEGMKALGIFSEVNDEVGQIIVAEVDRQRVDALLSPDQVELQRLITKR
jgi:isocitrate lyase